MCVGGGVGGARVCLSGLAVRRASPPGPLKKSFPLPQSCVKGTSEIFKEKSSKMGLLTTPAPAAAVFPPFFGTFSLRLFAHKFGVKRTASRNVIFERVFCARRCVLYAYFMRTLGRFYVMRDSVHGQWAAALLTRHQGNNRVHIHVRGIFHLWLCIRYVFASACVQVFLFYTQHPKPHF